jgi:hypothetical protein
MPIGVIDVSGHAQVESEEASLEKSKLQPGKSRCVCGRELTAASTYFYRSLHACLVFHRCACGVEWTEHHAGIGATDPVSSDEVIEVHLRLAKFEGSMSELLQHLST